MKKIHLLPILGILSLSPAMAATFSVSDYNWHESIKNGNVDERGVKLGVALDPMHITQNLTFQPSVGLALLNYSGTQIDNTNHKLSNFSFQVMLDNYLNYQFLNWKGLTLDAYGGLHALYRQIDPNGQYATHEEYLEPRVGLRAGYSFNENNSVSVGIYRAVKVWEFSEYGTFHPNPKLGYELAYNHTFNKKYTMSIYGDVSSYGVSNRNYTDNGSRYYYQPKTTISQVGVKLKIAF